MSERLHVGTEAARALSERLDSTGMQARLAPVIGAVLDRCAIEQEMGLQPRQLAHGVCGFIPTLIVNVVKDQPDPADKAGYMLSRIVEALEASFDDWDRLMASQEPRP